MEKFYTKSGYIAYKTTFLEVTTRLGGLGICDECGEPHFDGGYLVPVLNHWQCQKCFNEWESRATYYPEDVPFETRTAKYYEAMIPCTERKEAPK